MSKTLQNLYDVIESRRGDDPTSSYTAKLFDQGRAKIAQKVGEEGVETVIASLGNSTSETISESADLLYHLLVLWADMGIKPDDVWQELQKRSGISGIDEKNSREPGK